MKPLFKLTFTVFAVYLISCTDDNHSIKPKPLTLNMGSLAQQDPILALGRTLFYDTHLSVNNSISCATCHKQAYAFSDNVPFSRGFENQLTKRNSIPIQNLNNMSGFSNNISLFWDGRDSVLETMVLRPILNHVEMGMSDVDQLVERIRRQNYYSDLFNNAFSDGNISAENIALCLSIFVQQIQSRQSAFDLCGNSNDCLGLSASRGKILFNTTYHCNTCHQLGGYGQETASFRNIGLDNIYSDHGRSDLTHNPADDGKFKVPSLRNVALTAPYMHDGRFSSLEKVIDHYSHGIANHPNLDPALKTSSNEPIRMNIPEQDKADIISFLNALTDLTVVTEPLLSNPFEIQH